MGFLSDLGTWWKEKALPAIRKHPVAAAVAGAAAGLGSLLCVGGYIVTTGVIAGGLLASVAGVLLLKARRSENGVVKRVYASAVSHPLLADALITAAAFLLAPAGIVAWVAASTCGLVTSIWLLAENHKTLVLEETEAAIA